MTGETRDAYILHLWEAGVRHAPKRAHMDGCHRFNLLSKLDVLQGMPFAMFLLEAYVRIIILLISLALLVVPCSAGTLSFDDQVLVADAGKDKKEPPRGKVVIKGKGGKVTDVEKKPKKGNKKSK